jgi:hypothetical protein
MKVNTPSFERIPGPQIDVSVAGKKQPRSSLRFRGGGLARAPGPRSGRPVIKVAVGSQAQSSSTSSGRSVGARATLNAITPNVQCRYERQRRRSVVGARGCLCWPRARLRAES